MQNVYNLFAPQVDDPKKFVSTNKELVSRPAEDGIVVPVSENTTNEYLDPTTIFHQAANALTHPGTVGGTGVSPARYATQIINLAGVPRVGKIQAYTRGSRSIAPFGFVFSQVADNYADAQFTTAISDAYPTLVGDPIKAASFIAYEARLTRAVANALNRELAYSDGNTQSVRLAQLFCYERDLLWLQEVINGVARIIGYYEFANDLAIVNPALSATGLLQEPEFYSRMETLAKIVAQFKTIDPDTHTTLQFLNDFHITEKEYVRLPSINMTATSIHIPFSTNGAAVENITNATPIPYRITTTELNVVKSTNGNTLHVHDIMTQSWVDVLVFAVTKAKALAALDEIIGFAHGMIENYKDVLKYFNTIEGKKIATLNKMSEYLYFDGVKLTPVQPYYSYVERALSNGEPKVINIEGANPTVLAKCLVSFTTGAISTVGKLQAIFSSNFVGWGLDRSEKFDSSQEYFWQIWVPYSYATEAGVNTLGLFQFVNPFNGLTYLPDTNYTLVTAATCVKLYSADMSIDGTMCVGIYNGTAAATKNYPAMFYLGAWSTNTDSINLTAPMFGSPETDTKLEEHDNLYTQMSLQAQIANEEYAYVCAKNTALEVGFLNIKPLNFKADSFLMPISNAYFTVWASKYYADMFPAIDFQRSVAAQK